MPSISRAHVLGAACVMGLAALDPTTVLARGPDPGDVKMLNTALELERAAIKAYADAAATNLLSPAVLAVTQQFSNDHAAHRDALVAALTQASVKPSDATAPVTAPALASEADILSFAYTVERQAATAYLADVGQLKDRGFAQTSAAILGVETTHVALLAEALRKSPAYPSGLIV